MRALGLSTERPTPRPPAWLSRQQRAEPERFRRRPTRIDVMPCPVPGAGRTGTAAFMEGIAMTWQQPSEDADADVDVTGVRALLAGLPDPGPMPPEVSSRILHLLAQARAGGASPPARGEIDDGLAENDRSENDRGENDRGENDRGARNDRGENTRGRERPGRGRRGGLRRGARGLGSRGRRDPRRGRPEAPGRGRGALALARCRVCRGWRGRLRRRRDAAVPWDSPILRRLSPESTGGRGGRSHPRFGR